jgi:hypothetical protein
MLGTGHERLGVYLGVNRNVQRRTPSDGLGPFPLAHLVHSPGFGHHGLLS